MTMVSTPDAPRRIPRKPRAMDSYLGMRRQHREPLLARFVGHLRIIVPLAALAVLMIGLIWPLIYDSATGFRLNSAQVGGNRSAYSIMDNPRFAGMDGSDRPYVITADRAVQNAKDDKVYDLTQPRGDIVDKGGHWIFAQGDSGRLHQDTRQLEVAGNVIVYHDKGNRLEGERARVDLVTGDVASDRTVHGFGPSGTVVAEGMHSSQQGNKVLFTGRTHMVIDNDPDHVREADQPDASKAGGG